MFHRKFSQASDAVIDREAARWLARRDRGLSAAEQDDYLCWLQRDERHGAAIARHEATVRRMMLLASWQPLKSDEPNPDLFRRPRRRPSATAAIFLAAAAALVIGLSVSFDREPVTSPPMVAASSLRVNERQALPDGSVVELKDGSHIDVEFSASERRIRLTGGEAHFVVAKDVARPFLVRVGDVVVRAVGTAFNVRLSEASVEVVVTEGTVQVEEHAPVEADDAAPVAPPPPPVVRAGYRAVVALGTAARQAHVVPVSAQQMRQTLSWQAPRLHFLETPLADAVSDFNRHAIGPDRPRLVLGDPAVGALRIGGSFRVNNVDAFVSLLEVTLNIRVERRSPDEIVLRSAR